MGYQMISSELQELLADPQVLEFMITDEQTVGQIKTMRQNAEQLMRLANRIQKTAQSRFELAVKACKQHKYPRGGYVCEICGHDCE